MLCGHVDTVGVAGMGRPFDPIERDGRVYGRGSQDMKSGVAAMVDAARVLVQGGGLAAGQLLIACVVDEEHGSIGADALVTSWRADAAVVTEPTDLAVAIAHKGFEWVEIETEGRAAHGSRPRDGRDAIRLMARVLGGLDALDRTAPVACGSSPAGCGVPSCLVDPWRARAQLLPGPMPPADGARRFLARRPGSLGVSRAILERLSDADPEFKAAVQGHVCAFTLRDGREPLIADFAAARRQRHATRPRFSHK